MRLLLESTLALDGQFGSHLVGWAWAKIAGRGVAVDGRIPNSILPNSRTILVAEKMVRQDGCGSRDLHTKLVPVSCRKDSPRTFGMLPKDFPV